MTRKRAAGLWGTLVVAILAGAAAAWWLGPWRAAYRLPPRLRVTEPLADLSALFTREAVVAERAADPVRLGGLKPGRRLVPNEIYRRAIVAPPPARIRLRTAAPAGARLRFGAGVARDPARGPDAAGVRFVVRADGRTIFSREINPAARRRHRRWFDVDVALPAGSAEEVELTFDTEATETGAPLAGTPGWSHVRVVRETALSRQRAAAERPNVLVLLVDTLRADAVGCYGAAPSPTPTLDALAARGLVFEQAVAQAPWTLPSVASLFTGLYPPSHGVVAGQHAGADALGVHGDADPSFLSDTLGTLAGEAAHAGITTVGVSTNPVVSRDTNLARGFETFVELPRGERGWPAATEVNATFLAWLRTNLRHRFLAYLHYMDMHDPYHPPPGFRPAPAPGLRPRVKSGNVGPLALALRRGGAPLPAAEVDHLRRLYRGELAAWDGALAFLLGELERLGVADSTVLVVTSDHGEEFQEHGQLKHGIHVYDELLRVPLVLSGPGVARGRVGAQVQTIDLFPTIATVLGLAVPPGLPGQDLLGAPTTRTAFAETRYGRAADGEPTSLVALRTPRWKLIHAPALGRFELYDLARDPGEREDRWGKTPAGARLAALLARWVAETPPPPPPTGSDPRLHEKLRALGYVE